MKINSSLPGNYSSLSRTAGGNRRPDPNAVVTGNGVTPATQDSRNEPQRTLRTPASSKVQERNPALSQAGARAVQAYRQGAAAVQVGSIYSSVGSSGGGGVGADPVQRINSFAGRSAISAYAQHQTFDERDQVSRTLGIDTYA